VCVALVIQHAKRMRLVIWPMCRIISSSVVFLVIAYFPTFSHKIYDFRKKKIVELKKYVLVFATNFFWNISHFKKNSTRYYHKCAYGFCISTLRSCQNLMKLGFSRQISKKNKLEYKILSQSVPWEPICSMRTDGRTDMTKLTDAFRNFTNAPEDRTA
jgi:hypothetical protein